MRTDDEKQFIKRLHDLAEAAADRGTYCFTDFLSESEYSDLIREGPYSSPYEAYGGHESAERVMVRFGDPESAGCEEPFPIKIIKISQGSVKFSDKLSHRDYLGAVLNLGIDRKVTGDIITDGTTGYLFCEEKIADYIIENLVRVRHTNVSCEGADEVPQDIRPKLMRVEVQVSSERLDAVIAHILKLPRTRAADLFRAERVFVNGKMTPDRTYVPKEGDIISVRGFGRFRYAGLSHITKKGKSSIVAERYV
ncbi:MAG: hypothetical protein K5637_03300 [Lachnospiraceae bacterium]|nr:hypothetical protein [Lachnospiraceae bacterium]